MRVPRITDSLDMLLDTMCNTFGGVCFVALLIAVVTAMMPSTRESETQDEIVETERMLVDRERAHLARERDELMAALAVQKSLLEKGSASAGPTSESDLARAIASNSTSSVELRAELVGLETKLARLMADSVHSKQEAERIRRLLAELEEQGSRAERSRRRAVRTPVERELSGYTSVDVWLRHGRMYFLRNESHVVCEVRQGVNGREWDYSVRPGRGFLMDDDFFGSPEFRASIDGVSGKMFMRIFVDGESFVPLCRLRDELIRRRKLYNWHVRTENVLHFVEGYDGHVQ